MHGARRRDGRDLHGDAQPRRQSRSIVYIGDGRKGEPINDAAEQEKRIHEAVEQGDCRGQEEGADQGGKESSPGGLVSHRAGRDGATGVKLHVAVMEKDK